MILSQYIPLGRTLFVISFLFLSLFHKTYSLKKKKKNSSTMFMQDGQSCCKFILSLENTGGKLAVNPISTIVGLILS